MLKRQGLIETWHDRRIVPGDQFDRVIGTELEAAHLILLLVSPDFLASDYCYDVEMQRAMQRHEAGEARVVPIILRPCDWHEAPFGRLNALPKDGKPVTKWTDFDDAFLDITEGIKRVLGVSGASSVSSPPPRSRTQTPGPQARSSNLRIARAFTEQNKDDFLRETFEFIARFFDNSLEELSQRNSEVNGRFRRIDADRFTAIAYRSGHAVARCTIWFGGRRNFAGGIAYSHDDSGGTGSFNESLSVEEDEQALFLKPLGLSFVVRGGQSQKLTQEGGAELFWALFIEPLQRKQRT